MPIQLEQDLRFVDCHQTAVEGARCQEMIVRDASGIIGRVQGFVVDARIDFPAGEIYLLDENDTRRAQTFQPDLFPTF